MAKLKKPRGYAVLKENACVLCGAKCQSVCKSDAIEMDSSGTPIIAADKCNGCVKCVKICPSNAILMYLTAEEQIQLEAWKKQKAESITQDEEDLDPEEVARRERLAVYQDVWVFIEQTEAVAANVSWELLGEGKKLARKLDVNLCAVVIGSQVQHLCESAFKYGADKAYLCDLPVFKHYRTQAYRKALNYLIDIYKPEIILMGATGMGRDLAGAVATDVKTGLTADCTGLDIDANRNLMQTRPAFGGNIMATIMCDKFRPQMATVRPNVMDMPEPCHGTGKEIIRVEGIPVLEDQLLTKVLEIITDKKETEIDIAGAEFIISGGRGMMNQENFKILRELADEIGGVVGASRRAVDAGWMPHTRQVGQTGKTVRPKVYIACGISGAIQHLVGMQNADIVIAINRDKNAPIFEVATYGIVGDLFEIVPTITQEIRHRKQFNKSV